MVPLLVVLCAISEFSSAAIQRRHYAAHSAEHHFNQFIRNYNKQYENEDERERRFQIFKNNLDVINRRNSEDDSAEHGVTKFADLTAEEFHEVYGCIGMKTATASSCSVKSTNSSMDYTVPANFDWRSQNKVTSVKNQGHCGSCWTFSVIGSVESKYSIKHNDLKNFSEQQLVDCDKSGNGCQGGLLDHAMEYLKETGVMSYKDYPYVGHENGVCKYDPSKKVATVTKCYVHRFRSEEVLRQVLIDNGPLSIAIDASPLQLYSRGILSSCAWQSMNHAVLLVGYGTEGNIPHWIIKNSWGPEWGEDGYVRVKMNVDNCPMSIDIVSSDVA